MAWNLVLRFATWLPPATGMAYITVLAAAAAAAQAGNRFAGAFLNDQIAMLHAVSASPYIYAWALIPVLIWAASLFIVSKLASEERKGPIKLRVQLMVEPGNEQHMILSTLITNTGNKDAEIISIRRIIPDYLTHAENIAGTTIIPAGESIRTFDMPINEFGQRRTLVAEVEYAKPGNRGTTKKIALRFHLPSPTFVGVLDPTTRRESEDDSRTTQMEDIESGLNEPVSSMYFALERAKFGEWNIAGFTNEICVFEYRPDQNYVALKRMTRNNVITAAIHLPDTNLSADIIMFGWDDANDHVFLTVNEVDAPIVERLSRPSEESA